MKMNESLQLIFVPLYDGSRGLTMTIDFGGKAITLQHLKFPGVTGYVSDVAPAVLFKLFQSDFGSANQPVGNQQQLDDVGLTLAEEWYRFIGNAELDLQDEIQEITKERYGLTVEVMAFEYP